MTPAVWSALVISVGSLIVAIITSRQNQKGAKATNALTERVVDRGDFQAIVDELRESLTDVRNELAQVKKDLAAEVEARREAESRATAAEQRAKAAELRADAAEKRVDQLQRRVVQLERALGDRDIPVPPGADEIPDLD